MPTKANKGGWMPDIDFASKMLNRLSIVAIAVAGAAFMVLAFDEGRAEGIRAVIFFLIPAAWGAFAFAALDGQPKVFETVGKSAIPAGGVIAGLVISSVMIFDAPVSVANLALGSMAAFFFMMALADAPETRKASIPRGQHIWPLSILLMVTTIAVSVAITV